MSSGPSAKHEKAKHVSKSVSASQHFVSSIHGHLHSSKSLLVEVVVPPRAVRILGVQWKCGILDAVAHLHGRLRFGARPP